MEDITEVRRIIDRRNADICRAYAAGDADAVASVFSEDCWQMPPNSPPLVGREAVRQFWAEATRWAQWDFVIQAREVVVRDDIAVERGTYSLRLTTETGAPPAIQSGADSGNYLVLWRRESDGEWRALWDAPVSDRPARGSADTGGP